MVPFIQKPLAMQVILWMLWNSDRVEVTFLASTEQEIHTTVKVKNSNHCWLFTTIYASPRSAERHILWNNLNKVVDMHNMPRVLAGDFNKLFKRMISLEEGQLVLTCLFCSRNALISVA